MSSNQAYQKLEKNAKVYSTVDEVASLLDDETNEKFAQVMFGDLNDAQKAAFVRLSKNTKNKALVNEIANQIISLDKDQSGGSDFMHAFHSVTAVGNNAAISRATLANIGEAPMFNPLGDNTVIPTNTSGIVPNGLYLGAQTGGGGRKFTTMSDDELRTYMNTELDVSCRTTKGKLLNRRQMLNTIQSCHQEQEGGVFTSLYAAPPAGNAPTYNLVGGSGGCGRNSKTGRCGKGNAESDDCEMGPSGRCKGTKGSKAPSGTRVVRNKAGKVDTRRKLATTAKGTAVRLSARAYYDEHGGDAAIGDVCDIRGDGEMKCLTVTKTGVPRWGAVKGCSGGCKTQVGGGPTPMPLQYYNPSAQIGGGPTPMPRQYYGVGGDGTLKRQQSRRQLGGNLTGAPTTVGNWGSSGAYSYDPTY